MVKSCCEKLVGLKKGPWTSEEDQKLMAYIQQHGHGNWSSLPDTAGLQRCGKSCRLRWINYLRPDIKRGNFSSKEDQTIIQLHALLGNKWSAIAHHLPKRTDNEIKNYWNTCLKKRLTRMGINPNTHKPINTAINGQQSKDSTNLGHMAQWETARLEAEARQVKQYSKLQLQNQLGSSSSSSQPLPTRLVLNRVTPRPSPPPCLDVLKVWHNSLASSTSADQNTPRIMHSMYAMMLATDNLESPASTLSFPDTVPTNSKYATNTFGLTNQSLLFPSSSTVVANDNGIAKGVNKGEPCGNKGGNLVGDEDDIMAAVEALRSSGYNCSNSMESLHHDHVLAYNEKSASSEENLGVVSAEEEGQDWEAIFDLVNGLASSPVFFPVL